MAGPQSPTPQSTRHRIVARAIELFARRGFGGVTMRELGDAVGLDNSSLYRHFRSKAELANAALDSVTSDILSVVEASKPTAPLTLRQFEDLAVAVGVYLFDHPDAARMTMHWLMSTGDAKSGFALSVSAADTSRPHGRILQRLEGWLEEGARHGRLRKHAKPDAIVLLFSCLLMRPATFGYLLHSLEPARDRAAARRAWAREIRAFVSGAFAP